MNIKSYIFLTLLSSTLIGNVFAGEIEKLKSEIVGLAKSYEGQGDLDFSKQRSLEVLVNKLLTVAPQPPVKERLNDLYGVWKQVWGPYEYRKDDRSVDPTIGPKEIYQVIFEDGYYYNVAPNYKNGDRSKLSIGLLKGTYKLDPKNENNLLVQFQKNTKVDGRPTGLEIYQLPELSEAGTLRGERRTLPDIVVRYLFGKGALIEVYTDSDLRILFGSNDAAFKKKTIYIMTKIRP